MHDDGHHTEPEGRPLTSAHFTGAERDRFHNLLKLAAESPFEGERANALAAAERLAERHGMSVDEAAGGGALRKLNAKEAAEARAVREFVRSMAVSDYQIQVDKGRREAAIKDAMERGLDASEREAANRRVSSRKSRPGGRGRNQYSHARVLLAETSLPLQEVASITGLDMYKVVGLKLKMRQAGEFSQPQRHKRG